MVGRLNSKPVAGSYAFAMTAYVSGAFTGLVSNDTSPEVTASNNTIQVTVDGTQSGSVSVPAAHYTSEAALATAIQTAINADSTLSSAGKTVVVTHANGSYSIKSGSIGASSSMVINAIGSNLDGFVKFVGSTDADNPFQLRNLGTASSDFKLNGTSISGGEFNDSAGKRISITSNSADESGYTFTIVGKDLSNTDQTAEVISYRKTTIRKCKCYSLLELSKTFITTSNFLVKPNNF